MIALTGLIACGLVVVIAAVIIVRASAVGWQVLGMLVPVAGVAALPEVVRPPTFVTVVCWLVAGAATIVLARYMTARGPR